MTDELPCFTSWNREVASLLGAPRAADFPVRLMRALHALAAPDPPSLAILFRPEHVPVVIHEGETSAAARRNTGIYVAGAYVLDPYYRAGTDGLPSGFYRLRDLVSQGFRRSEYYRRYYARAGLQDEAGYVVHTGGGAFVNVSLARERAPGFTRREVARLAAAAPLVVRLCVMHWGPGRGQEARRSGTTSRLERVYESFGRDGLTPREQDVLRLVLRGHSVKSAAAALGVSPDTIKLHRKHIYAKLGVASQAALFARLVAALAGEAGAAATYPPG